MKSLYSFSFSHFILLNPINMSESIIPGKPYFTDVSFKLQYKEVYSDSLPNTAPISLNSLHLQTILLCFLFYIDHQADYDMKISL